jgi:orotidine-5'-phosphate decarboxylase
MHTAASSISAKDRLIFALDVPTVDAAREWIDKLDGVVSFFKIGLELYIRGGVSLVPYLLDKNKKVFLDLKYYDIPETVKRATQSVGELGVSFLTIHGDAQILKAAVEGRGNSPLKLLAVTVLTSMNDEKIKDLGYNCSVEELVLLRARHALLAGCDGVISSPREAAQIRDLVLKHKAAAGNEFLIVTPGIRPQSLSLQDHQRSSTPTAAIQSGANFLVVGRPIRDAEDPPRAAQTMICEMQHAFDSRV